MTDPNGNSRASARWLEDGSYFKITNVELGVTLPSETLNKAKISISEYMLGRKTCSLSQNIPDLTPISVAMAMVDVSFGQGCDQASYPVKSFNNFAGGLPNPRTFLVGVQLGL